MLPFVCRRWERLCFSPELLRTVDLAVEHEGALRSAACFLQRAAGHLRELHLHLIMPATGDISTHARLQILLQPLRSVSCNRSGFGVLARRQHCEMHIRQPHSPYYCPAG